MTKFGTVTEEACFAIERAPRFFTERDISTASFLEPQYTPTWYIEQADLTK